MLAQRDLLLGVRQSVEHGCGRAGHHALAHTIGNRGCHGIAGEAEEHQRGSRPPIGRVLRGQPSFHAGFGIAVDDTCGITRGGVGGRLQPMLIVSGEHQPCVPHAERFRIGIVNQYGAKLHGKKRRRSRRIVVNKACQCITRPLLLAHACSRETRSERSTAEQQTTPGGNPGAEKWRCEMERHCRLRHVFRSCGQGTSAGGKHRPMFATRRLWCRCSTGLSPCE